MRNEKDELGPCSESITTSATFSFGSLETALTVGESLFFGDSRQVLLLAGNILVLLHLPLSQRRPTRLDKALYCIKLSIFFDLYLEREYSGEWLSLISLSDQLWVIWDWPRQVVRISTCRCFIGCWNCTYPVTGHVFFSVSAGAEQIFVGGSDNKKKTKIGKKQCAPSTCKVSWPSI